MMWFYQYNLGKMLFILAILFSGIYFIYDSLLTFFWSNSVINGIILFALFIGIIYAFRSVAVLWSEWKWLETLRNEDFLSSDNKQPFVRPRLTTVLANFYEKLLQARSLREPLPILSPDLLAATLHSVESRLHESRETLRYFVGLLVFLGLLGTFWGLLDVLQSISFVVSNLDPLANSANVLADLRNSLEAPLEGMGTAFSSSLFGLGGSLILGVFALQVSQAQNRFYNNLEVFLSDITPLFDLRREGGEGLERPMKVLEKLSVAQAEWLERLVASQTQLERNISSLLQPQNEHQTEQLEALRAINRSIESLRQDFVNRDE